MSEIEFLRRAVHCKEAQESATNDLSRAEWGAMAAQWLRLANQPRKPPCAAPNGVGYRPPRRLKADDTLSEITNTRCEDLFRAPKFHCSRQSVRTNSTRNGLRKSTYKFAGVRANIWGTFGPSWGPFFGCPATTQK